MTAAGAGGPPVPGGPVLHRRGFLRALGVAAAAGVLPVGCGGAARRHALLHALTARIAGPAAADAIARGAVDPAEVAAAWLARMGPLADALGAALAVLEWGVWPLVPKWRRFSALAPGEQDAVLAHLRDGRWSVQRQLFAGVKTLCLLAWYSQPASHEAIGYPGPFADVSAAMTWSEER